MSNYTIYDRLGTKSRRYWQSIVANPKKLCSVRFRSDLIYRLSNELGLSFDDTWKVVQKELVQFVKDHQR